MNDEATNEEATNYEATNDENTNGENADGESAGGENADGENARGLSGPTSGRKEEELVYLRRADMKELERVVSARDGYKSVPHLVREFLSRSLLPRIEEERYFPGRLVSETAGRRSAGGPPRKKLQLGLESREPVEAAAWKLSGDLRRLEERRAWEGGVGALPFCRCGAAEVVRAAAREIATWSQGGPSKLFSREEAPRWLGPGPAPGAGSGEEVGGAPPRSENSGTEASGSEASGSEGTYQLLTKLPGRERGGKPVKFYVTGEAKRRLKRKGARLGQTGSDLARRATRLLVGWVEEAPAEAIRYIREESDLYQGSQEEETSGFQVYVAEETKRRVEQARARLRRGAGRGRQTGQKDILQAAARLAIEADDEDMRPPLPGGKPGR